MNCQEFEAMVADLARAGRTMDSELRQSGLEHAETCRGCAALLADQRMLSLGLRALAESSAEAQVPGRLEGALRSAFRVQTALPSKTAGRWRANAWLLATAACLVLGLVTAGRLFERARVPEARPQPQAPTAQTYPRTAVAQVASAPVPAAAHPRAAPGVRRRPGVRAQRASAPPKVDEEMKFVPLFYGAAPMPLDGGHVVRLKLPRSALVALGLPTNANRADAVQADVLFAQDGMARAIRFVPR